MPYIHETPQQMRTRVRNGRITLFLALGWWVLSIGGIIYVLNTTS